MSTFAAQEVAILAPEESAAPVSAVHWLLDLQGMTAATAEQKLKALRSLRDGVDGLVQAFHAPEGMPGMNGQDLVNALRQGPRGLALRISLPARVHYVPGVRRFIGGRVGDRFGARAAFCMELVFDELCLNAIEHGAGFPSRVEIEVEAKESVLHYRVSNTHTGPAGGAEMHNRVKDFDASGAYLGERGRGLFLVARMSDGLHIETTGERVCVHAWTDLRSFASAPSGDSA